jgi:hypothetical protein
MVTSKPKAKKQPKKRKIIVIEAPVEKAPTKLSVFMKLMVFENAGTKNKEHKELWKVEVPVAFKGQPLISRVSSKFAAILVKEAKRDELILFIYDIMGSKYIGFVNFT